eukprot:439494-Rhodomonas_salina.1
MMRKGARTRKQLAAFLRYSSCLMALSSACLTVTCASVGPESVPPPVAKNSSGFTSPPSVIDPKRAAACDEQSHQCTQERVLFEFFAPRDKMKRKRTIILLGFGSHHGLVAPQGSGLADAITAHGESACGENRGELEVGGTLHVFPVVQD